MENSSSIEMYQLDIEELTKFIEQAKRPNIRRHFEELRKNMTILLDQEKKNIEKTLRKSAEENKPTSDQSTEAKENVNPATEQNKTFNESLNFVTISKYSLDTSSDKFVKVYLTEGLENLKNINPKNILTNFTEKTFDVCVLDWNKKNFRFNCRNLNKNINPKGSYAKPTSSGLILYLEKAKSGDHWDSLEKKKSLVGGEENEESPETAKGAKDPSASLMDMMRDMYQSGDPEMKKIIAEAWTKSQTGGNKDI